MRPVPEQVHDQVSQLLGIAPQWLQRLPGGSKKGAYRVGLIDGSTLIAYVWDASENYWPAREDDEPFAEGSGQRSFMQAHTKLRELGVRTVDVVAHDEGVALVEDLVGGSLESAIRTDPAVSRSAVRTLREDLATMHASTSADIGKIGSPVLDPAPCEVLAYRRATHHFAEARARRPELPDELLDVLDDAFAAVKPRADSHALIHGELGPDHVYLDRRGAPVLIDIEGLMHFDVEWDTPSWPFALALPTRPCVHRDWTPPGYACTPCACGSH